MTEYDNDRLIQNWHWYCNSHSSIIGSISGKSEEDDSSRPNIEDESDDDSETKPNGEEEEEEEKSLEVQTVSKKKKDRHDSKSKKENTPDLSNDDSSGSRSENPDKEKDPFLPNEDSSSSRSETPEKVPEKRQNGTKKLILNDDLITTSTRNRKKISYVNISEDEDSDQSDDSDPEVSFSEPTKEMTLENSTLEEIMDTSRPVRSSFCSALSKMNKLNDNVECSNDESRKRKRNCREEIEEKPPQSKRQKMLQDALSRKCSVPLQDVAKEKKDEMIRKYFTQACTSIGGKTFPGIESRFLEMMPDTDTDPTVKVSSEKLRKLLAKLDYYKRHVGVMQQKLRNGNGQEQDDENVSPAEKLSLLGDIQRPTIDKSINFMCTKGYRIFDLQTFRVALGKAQDCGCAKLGKHMLSLILQHITFTYWFL